MICYLGKVIVLRILAFYEKVCLREVGFEASRKCKLVWKKKVGTATINLNLMESARVTHTSTLQPVVDRCAMNCKQLRALKHL